MKNLTMLTLAAALAATATQAVGAQALQNNVAVNNLSAMQDQELMFTLDVPDQASNIRFDIVNGSGDADLYVGFNQVPTDYSWDCRPFVSGNTESCQGYSSNGTYYVRVKAYTDFEGLTLVGQYQEFGDSDCEAPAWDPQVVYLQNDRVSQNGHVYQAKWFNMDQTPELNSSEFQVWALQLECE